MLGLGRFPQGRALLAVYVGTTAGQQDLYGQSQATNLATTVSGLPVDGRRLYVRLWSLIGSTWHFNDYVYTAKASAN